MGFCVYVLKNDIGRTYTGHTGCLENRFWRHAEGLSYWTSRFGGWKVVYSESFATRGEAMRRERELKSGKGRDELRRKGVI